MPLFDALRKKDTINAAADAEPKQPLPEFKFLRTTTDTQEVLQPPEHPDEPPPDERSRRRLTSPFKRASRTASPQPAPDIRASPESRKKNHRISSALHLNRSRGASTSSPHVPEHLPDISILNVTADGAAEEEEAEARWERRATLLAAGARSRSVSASGSDTRTASAVALTSTPSQIAPMVAPVDERPPIARNISGPAGDVNIQEAIRLHEAGDLDRSTDMFGKLADPHQGNNALAQVLYGLALRHGWGIEPDPARALTYLSAAAENAAEIESAALQQGKRKGGAAKGELTLAIYELANSFRHGWGVARDPVAARQYYGETRLSLLIVDSKTTG